jgi:hypothetical protein
MIEYDIKVHLKVIHRMEGNGLDMGFVTNIMRRKKSQEFYDHKAAKFAQLHS